VESIEIKKVSEENLEMFAKLIKDSRLKEDFQFSEELPIIEGLRKLVVNPVRNIFYSLINGEPCGFVNLFYPKNEERNHLAIVQAIQIVPTFRGRGVGSHLLQYALDQIKKDGKKLVTLEVVDANERAVNLYKNKKFKIYGNLPNSFIKDGKNYATLSMYLEL